MAKRAQRLHAGQQLHQVAKNGFTQHLEWTRDLEVGQRQSLDLGKLVAELFTAGSRGVEDDLGSQAAALDLEDRAPGRRARFAESRRDVRR
jgi:hypothetical protein